METDEETETEVEMEEIATNVCRAIAGQRLEIGSVPVVEVSRLLPALERGLNGQGIVIIADASMNARLTQSISHIQMVA